MRTALWPTALFATAALATGVALTPTRAGDPPGHHVQQGHYGGSKSCKKCHFKETKAWEETPHAKAFEVLAPGAASEAKTKNGLDPQKDYRADAACVACHVVGAGQPGGYAPGYDVKKDKERLLGVGCEVCHGAGGDLVADGLKDKDYKAQHDARLPKLLAKGYVPKPTAELCTGCHGPASPTYHGSFDFEVMKKKGVHATQ